MKRKLPITILILVCIFQASFGQVTEVENKLKKQVPDTLQGWKKGAITNLNLAQSSLTNWAAGGENSLAVNGLLSAFLNYKNDKISWNSTLDIGYGLLKQGNGGAYRKTDDKFDFLSKIGREAVKNLYYTALLNFKTQMGPGYDYPTDTTETKISDFLAPAYIILALGLDYQPDPYLSIFAAPITERITIVNDQALADSGAFGVKPATFDAEHTLLKNGEKVRYEFGGYVRMIYTKNNFKSEVLKNVVFTTKIDLFSNYLKNPQNIDVNWETLLAFKVNKFLVVNFNMQLIYDDDIKIHYDKNNPDKTGPRTQFKEILGVGFSYTFK
jgi:hypothetical protein